MPQPVPPRRNWFARHKILTGLGVGVLIIVIGNLANSGGSDPAGAGPAPAESSAPAATKSGGAAKDTSSKTKDKPAAPAAAGIGDAVRGGNFEIVVSKVRCGEDKVGTEYFNKAAQGQFCLVSIKVTNVADSAAYLTSEDVVLYDAKDREFSADTEAMIYHDESADIWLEEINPGNTVKGDMIFDIPEKTEPVRLVFNASFWSQPAEVDLTQG